MSEGIHIEHVDNMEQLKTGSSTDTKERCETASSGNRNAPGVLLASSSGDDLGDPHLKAHQDTDGGANNATTKEG